MLISTLAVTNYEVKRHIGVVYGNSIRGAGMISDMMGKITDLFGGKSRSYEAELEAAQDEAMQKLIEKAQAHNSNAVLGVHFSTACLPMSRGGLFIVTVMGTAVEL